MLLIFLFPFLLFITIKNMRGRKIKSKDGMMSILAIIMIIPMFYGLIISAWSVTTQTKRHFTQAQIEEISDALHFEIARHESVTTVFFPGIMQASATLEIHIKNIDSEEDFLSRFSGNAERSESRYANPHIFLRNKDVNIVSTFTAEMFQFEQTPKDYFFYIYIIEDEGILSAVFSIGGYVPQLSRVYQFIYHWIINYLPLIIPFAIEVFLFTYIIISDKKRN